MNMRLDGDSYPMKFMFRVLFKHGEHIDFYADNQEKYEEWLEALNRVMNEKPEDAAWLGGQDSEPASKEPSVTTQSKKRPTVGDINWKQDNEDEKLDWFSSIQDQPEEDSFVVKNKSRPPIMTVQDALAPKMPQQKVPIKNAVEVPSEEEFQIRMTTPTVGIYGTQRGRKPVRRDY